MPLSPWRLFPTRLGESQSIGPIPVTNRHTCWYGTSSAGKGYSLRVLLSRERSATGLTIHGIDQDEQQEYAGRSCDYLDGARVLSVRQDCDRGRARRSRAGPNHHAGIGDVSPPSLEISPEERDRIEEGRPGEGLLVATGRRVWVNLYGHTSPGELRWPMPASSPTSTTTQGTGMLESCWIACATLRSGRHPHRVHGPAGHRRGGAVDSGRIAALSRCGPDRAKAPSP